MSNKIIGVTVGTPLNPAKFGGASQEQIAQAVVDYLTKNPVEGGGFDAIVDGETLVIAVSSTATIENETLIL